MWSLVVQYQCIVLDAIRHFLDRPQDDIASAKGNYCPKVQMESAIAHAVVE
jgi:hypothetical protein